MRRPQWAAAAVGVAPGTGALRCASAPRAGHCCAHHSTSGPNLTPPDRSRVRWVPSPAEERSQRNGGGAACKLGLRRPSIGGAGHKCCRVWPRGPLGHEKSCCQRVVAQARCVPVCSGQAQHSPAKTAAHGSWRRSPAVAAPAPVHTCRARLWQWVDEVAELRRAAPRAHAGKAARGKGEVVSFC